MDNEQQIFLFLHNTLSKKPKKPTYFDHRSFVVGENVDAFPSKTEDNKFTLKVTGYVRGNRPISANSLVYIPGFGAHHIEAIYSAEDPENIMKKSQKKSKEMEGASFEPTVLFSPEAGVQEQLDKFAEVDENMNGMEVGFGSTMDLDVTKLTKPKSLKKRVPEGTSEYQATWITESDNENGSDEEEYDTDDDEDEMMASDDDDIVDRSSVVTASTAGGLLGPVDADQYDAKFGFDDEEALLEMKKNAEQEDRMYPDEVDTPMDIPARVRFQKYRGLQSFRSSPWDTEENLPQEYGKIFQFENFNRTKRRIYEKMVEEGACVGWYITLHIANVSEECARYCTRSSTQLPGSYEPLVIHSMLPHEQKFSVINMLIKRVNWDEKESEVAVKNKQTLVFKVGYRWFRASPIFSEHATAHKFKVCYIYL